jgi:xanthine dehydrogenase accessory factor
MDFFERVTALRLEGQSFALATVVARRPPVSAHLGDRAIVFADGRMEGFIGGACSREIIRQQALAALKARTGRLVSIRPDAPDAAASTPEHVIAPMSCASEGAVDVFVEPFVRARRIVVVGATPVAGALTRVARSMEYDVVRAVDADEQHDIEPEAASLGVSIIGLGVLEAVLREAGPDDAVIVASQGHYDEEALQTILQCDAPYVALVASRKRADTVRGLLRESGVAGLERIRNPAGLDLGARTPTEVALSILAEIVQLHPSGRPSEADASEQTAAAAMGTAVDPVCGMDVDVATARHTADVDGTRYYFCCAGCRARFMHDPQQFRHAS